MDAVCGTPVTMKWAKTGQGRSESPTLGNIAEQGERAKGEGGCLTGWIRGGAETIPGRLAPFPFPVPSASRGPIGTSHTASWRWPTASSTFVSRCSSPSCRGSASPRAAAACSSACRGTRGGIGMWGGGDPGGGTPTGGGGSNQHTLHQGLSERSPRGRGPRPLPFRLFWGEGVLKDLSEGHLTPPPPGGALKQCILGSRGGKREGPFIGFTRGVFSCLLLTLWFRYHNLPVSTQEDS